MQKEVTKQIKSFLREEISLKKLTSELNREKEYLFSLSTQNNQKHTEIAYSIYFSPEKECNICLNEMKFRGFSKGYLCCKKCETIKKMDKITKEESIQEIKDLYEKYEYPDFGDKNFKSFSQSSRKYLKRFWEIESKINWNKCLYDILYIKSEEKCKCCDNKINFSSYKFRYSVCCSVACMTKYQIAELTPWTEKRKEIMIENIKKTKLERYGDENYNNIKKGRNTNIERGNWLPDDKLDDFKLYSRKVWYWTRCNNLNELENIDKRGRADKQLIYYHLDHKYSIFQGFKDNIPSYIIGGMNNLEMITGPSNCSKRSNCSITKQDLFNI